MLSTITARLTKKNDDYIASITGGMGVIDKNTGELRSTYDILQDLSKAWEHLSSVEKQELTEKVAGKTQRALFTAIMTNFKTAVDATSDALDSESSAAIENEKRMNSLQGKTQQLQSAWQSLSRDTINSEFIKALLDAGTGILKFANSDIGKTIASIAALLATMKLLTSGFTLIKTAILTNGQALFQYLLILQGVPAAQAAASASSLGLAGSLKILTTALVTNPIFLAVTAFSALAIVLAGVSQKAKEAREASKKLSEDQLDEANSAQSLLDQYEELSKKKNRTKEEDEKLNKTISELNDKYGISKDALKAEGKERDEAIKKVKAEIAEKKRLAAISQASSIDWKKTNLTGSQTEKEVVTSRKAIEIQDKLSKKYDLTGATVSELQKKMAGYITTLQNKNNKTKEEESELNKLSSLYEKVSGSVDTYKSGYSQALENYKEGIPITTEQGNALYQLGEITENDAIAIEAYNNWLEKNQNATEEQKEAVYEGLQAQADMETQTDNNAEATEHLTEKQKEYKQALADAKEAQNDETEKIDEAQKSFKTLSTAVDEYNNSGYLSIDTLQSLLALSDDQIANLSLQNGQLSLNTQSIDEMTDALVAQRVNQLQAAATEDLYNLAIGNTESMSTLAKTAIANLDSQTSGIGSTFSSQVTGITEFTNALLAAKAAAGDSSTENFEAKANAVIQSYQNVYKSITDLGKGTSKAGGTGGSNHRYTGKGKGSGGSGRKSGSGSKGSSKSTKEEYKAEIDTLYAYKNAVENAKESVDKLKDAIKDTDNFNEQEKYIRQVIDALNDEINKTNDLKDAQTRQINDYINQLRAQGFSIDYNAQKNELYINNMQHLADFSGDAAKKLEKLIKKTQDLNDDNRDLDGTIRDLRSDVKDYYKQLEDIPEKKLKKFNELMKEFQQGRLEQIQNQIDDIQHEMDNDVRLKQLENQIEALENQNDELDKQKELEEKLLAVEQAKEKLANQKKQKNIQIYRENQRMGKIMPSSIVICCVISNYIGQRLEVAET